MEDYKNFYYDMCAGKLDSCYDFLFRMKVDLTKYIEEHLFSFDNAYSQEADNQ